MVTSMYAIVFDKSCAGWTESRDLNLTFVKYVCSYANNLLKQKRYVLLETVYKELGKYDNDTMPKFAKCCGWIHADYTKIGDGFIDFEIDLKETGPNITIDFNVDGEITYNILDTLGEPLAKR